MHDDEIKPIGQLIRDYIDGKIPKKEYDDLIKFLHSQEKWLDCKKCQGKGFWFKYEGKTEVVKSCSCELGRKYSSVYP